MDKHASVLGQFDNDPSDISYKENEVLENDSSALAIKPVTRAFHKKLCFLTQMF
jgi:hypothetical protein